MEDSGDQEFNPVKVVKQYFRWNRLHMAAVDGKTEFFRHLSETVYSHQRSQLHFLSETLDSHQRSPLHLASAHGHSEIVKLLVKANPKMLLACDRDGLNPLHAAAVTGKDVVLDDKELFEDNLCAARARVDKGERETILHLCVKHNQFKFLQKLLDKYFKGEEFVNAEDLSGNTILHLAVAYKRFEIIKHVLKNTKIDTKATNASNHTARDILLLGRRKRTEPEGWERRTEERAEAEGGEVIGIEDLLQKHYRKRPKDATQYEWIEKKRKSLTIVAILMATIAFQAGVNPPGGVWVDNMAGDEGHQAGEAVMAYNHPKSYFYFIRCNTIGFVASLITISCLISGAPFRKRPYLVMMVVVMCVSITSMGFTYAYAIFVFTPKRKRESVDHTVAAAVIVWFGVQAILLLFHGSRLMKNIYHENREKTVVWFHRFGCWNQPQGVRPNPSPAEEMKDIV